ncbi:galactosyldiacylglycerol synthase [Ramlibacter henchirensis]|uniref:Galactosyldiacylglycerol synthase n=1 Tax=Ramlibacter henchirensis TaxID=204072 RepID=A0A4Z0BMW2_9BURK|nr:glycosyltransferase [Ramlibacter henchirensis]TFZ00633.1 galactosyldiacylglycerol synthase [Ramlibacter henchirensis]
MTPAITLVYFNAGGGHRAAAQALEQVIAEQGRPWRVERINVMEVLDPERLYKRLTGMEPEDWYNARLATGFTLGLAQELKVFQATLRLLHPFLVQRLRDHWLRTEPDMVVSLIPNMNRCLYESLASALPGVPYVTAMTDLADYPPNFWVEPGQRQHYICGTDRAVRQAFEQGCEPWQVHRTSGMILRPDFYKPVAQDRRAAREALGLDPDRPTGVVMFGGHGSAAMLSIAKELHDVQLVLLCGHNASVARRLRRMPAQSPRAVVEFTPNVREYMQLGDFLIGKPGPGSLSEAVHMGLPVVTVRNSWTMPQERYNTGWLLENGFGVVGTSMRKLREPVNELLARLDELRASVAKVRNRAVFEVPDILEQVLREAGQPVPGLPEVQDLRA